MAKHQLSVVPKIKRLFYDIETSPNVGLFFGSGYNITVNPNAIIHERKIICIGYKWEGEKKVNVLVWDKNQDDRELLRDFILIANEADELVAHFGDRFDLPWIRTRCLLHRLEPLPFYKTIDTKAWASKYFYFNSNKLDYISKFLGYGGKEKMEFQDWFDIQVHACPRALKKMVRYCGIDVLRLEEVYQDLKFCVKPKSHAGVLGGREKWTCPRDGSTSIRKSKTRTTSSGTMQHQMKCLTCNGYFTISDTVFKQFNERERASSPKGRTCCKVSKNQG